MPEREWMRPAGALAAVVGRVAAVVAAGGLMAGALAGCGGGNHGAAAPTTTVAHPSTGLTAPQGSKGAGVLAADIGCGHFDPLALSGLPLSLGAASAGTCSVGSAPVLIVTFANPGVISRALRLAGGLGVLAGSAAYVAEGPNWLAAGTQTPSQGLAQRIVDRVGGQVKKVTTSNGQD